MILVTGGAGFIGANFVLDWLAATNEPIVNLDKLTYAGNRENLAAHSSDVRHVFVQGDICDQPLVARLLNEYQPRAIVHFAAESHVDRSVHGPTEFVRTNVEGTFTLLQAARVYWAGLAGEARAQFRFLYISTDEVYGSLGHGDPPFTENTAYAPNNPYSASKAAGDHLARAWYQTYDLPVLITHCSNNYGPYQFPEKLMPLVITHALAGKTLPIYGDGQHIRDWLYVADHCAAIRVVLARGRPGETYNIGGGNEITNLEVVHILCDLLDEMVPDTKGSYRRLIKHVQDRPGHDQRYAIDASKIKRELGWCPDESFDTGIRKTMCWYLEHQNWVSHVITGEYRQWMEKNHSEGMSP